MYDDSKIPTVLIHGIDGDVICWNEFLDHNEGDEFLIVRYIEPDQNIQKSVDQVYTQIRNEFGDRTVNIIGYSLGGVIGYAISKTDINVNKLVTVASTISGVPGLNIAPSQAVRVAVKDLATKSDFMIKLHETKPEVDILCVRATKSTKMLIPVMGRNDGVAPVSAMTIRGAKTYDYHLDHYDIIDCVEMFDAINEFMAEENLDIKVAV